MSSAQAKRGSTPVEFIAELGQPESTSVICLRLWRGGPDAQAQVRNDVAAVLVRLDVALLICAEN